MPLTSMLKAKQLLKHNIDALLKARGQTRHDLAVWCRRDDSWLSKIMNQEDDKNVQLSYLDRIADFFGLVTYQLFQPGISPLTERRVMIDRRAGRDRRISRALPISQKPGDVDLMDVIRALSREGRERAIEILGDILNDEIQGLRTTRPAAAPSHHRPHKPPVALRRPKKKGPSEPTDADA